MELNNFEKQARQKLNQREVKPSINSWDRLDAMLNVEEKPKKKGFFWINIAASFIVLASIGYYFYNQNTIVEPIKEEQIIVEVENNLENREDKIESTAENHEVVVENNNLIKENKNSSIEKQQVVAISDTKNQQPIANYKKEVSIINQPSKNQQKTVAELDLVNNQNTAQVAPKYISPEKLLAEVSNEKHEITNINEPIKKSSKGVLVSPNSLLSNAEAELNQSYRESALDRLNKNFNSIKTVLANRNYEE